MEEYSIEWFKWHRTNNSKWLGTQAIELLAHYIQLEEAAVNLVDCLENNPPYVPEGIDLLKQAIKGE